jgi:hypothetical protein
VVIRSDLAFPDPTWRDLAAHHLVTNSGFERTPESAIPAWFGLRNFLDGTAAKKKTTCELYHKPGRPDVTKLCQSKLPWSILFYGGSGDAVRANVFAKKTSEGKTAAHAWIKSERMFGGRRANWILISA